MGTRAGCDTRDDTDSRRSRASGFVDAPTAARGRIAKRGGSMSTTVRSFACSSAASADWCRAMCTSTRASCASTSTSSTRTTNTFACRDARIFRHLARVIDVVSPPGARVLDIGGARGDLMAHVVARRPDLCVVVNDIAAIATSSAAERFGFATLTGDAHALAEHDGRYDVIVLSDMLVYEPDIHLLWTALGRLLAPGGSVVIRSQNKWLLIRLWQRWYRATRPHGRQRLQDRIRAFNPEHIYVIRSSYLKRRLEDLGLRHVRVLPSPQLAAPGTRLLTSLYFAFASAVNRLSRGAVALTPSIVLVGTGRRRQIEIRVRGEPRVLRVRSR